MNNDTSPHISLISSIVLIVYGAFAIITGSGGSQWGIPTPGWAGWVVLPIGIYTCILSIRALRRGEGKYTAEDAVRAKEEMDRMHLKEYGSLPEDVTRKKDA